MRICCRTRARKHDVAGENQPVEGFLGDGISGCDGQQSDKEKRDCALQFLCGGAIEKPGDVFSRSWQFGKDTEANPQVRAGRAVELPPFPRPKPVEPYF